MLADDLRAHFRVLLHDAPFIVGQAPGLEQDVVRDADLADVVHGRGVQQQLGGLFAHPRRQGKQPGIMAHPDNVESGLVVPEFRGAAQASDDFQPGLDKFLGAFLDRLSQPPSVVVEFQVGLGPGENDGLADGLGDVIHRPQFQAPGLVRLLPQGGEEDHRDIAGPVMVLQPPTDLPSVHPGHHDVEQNEIRDLVGVPQGILAVGREDQFMVVAQDIPQETQIGRFVVHYQYTVSHGPSDP